MSQDTVSADRILKPGQIIYPEVSISTAKELIRDHFGYNTKRITALNSYDDKNFFVEVSPVGSSEGDEPTRKFVFKVLNSHESKKQHFLAENAAMLFLQSKGISCPVPEPSTHPDRSTCPLIELPCKKDIDNNESTGDRATVKSHVIRLLSFVEGEILTDVPVTAKLLYDLGLFTANLQTSFKEFSHSALENNRSIWFLCSTPQLKEFTYVIQSEPDKFKMVSEVLEAFSTRVVPMYPKLRKGVIHGDLNEQNIIVRKVEQDGGRNTTGYTVSGIIDFGDLQINYYVFELALLLAYMMLECLKTDMDPLEGIAHVISGFHSKNPIPADEFQILRICICSRLCQSVVLGRYSYTLDPSNEYLLTTAKHGWNLLDKLWNQTTDQQLFSIWKKVIPGLIFEN